MKRTLQITLINRQEFYLCKKFDLFEFCYIQKSTFREGEFKAIGGE